MRIYNNSGPIMNDTYLRRVTMPKGGIATILPNAEDKELQLLRLGGGNHGTVKVLADRGLVYQPRHEFVGCDRLTYRARIGDAVVDGRIDVHVHDHDDEQPISRRMNAPVAANDNRPTFAATECKNPYRGLRLTYRLGDGLGLSPFAPVKAALIPDEDAEPARTATPDAAISWVGGVFLTEGSGWLPATS